MTRSADDKRARFTEAAHSQDVPAPSRVGADYGPEAEPSAGCSGATPRAADSLRELHLFAGAGGGILGGMLLGHTPVCAVEIDKYCRRVLEARQADGCLPPFPVFADVCAFDGRPWRGRVDVVAGGFPCQPWSQAGKQKGADDPRHLWPQMARIVEEVRPRYVFAENVSLAALEEPWRDLRGLGYRVPPALCVAASDVGAPHLRKRWWLLAQLGDPDGFDRSQKHPRHDVIDQQWAQVGRGAVQQSGAGATSGNVSRCSAERTAGGGPGKNVAEGQGAVADADSGRRQKREERDLEPSSRQSAPQRHDTVRPSACNWWQTEPAVGRVVNGLAYRVDRLRALGNGQVPMAAATAWHYLMQQLGT